MTDWTLAGIKSWVTRRRNARRAIRKLQEAGRKSWVTRKRRAAARKAWKTRRLGQAYGYTGTTSVRKTVHAAS
jgi:hypothetical protein